MPTADLPEEDLILQSIELPRGDLALLQPREAVELPDVGPVEWAPLAPYWSVIWRSGVALASELDLMDLAGLRVVELGCGLGVPSIAAARAGAEVVATDESPEALALLARNAEANGIRIEIATIDWEDPGELVERAPFDLALASDVLYEPAAVPALVSLLPRLAPRALLADPGRPAAVAVVKEVLARWPTETLVRGEVRIHKLELAAD